MGDTALDKVVSLVESLEMLMKNDTIRNLGAMSIKFEIRSIFEKLISMKTFLKDSEMGLFEYGGVKDLLCEIRDLANDAECIIELPIINAISKPIPRRTFHPSPAFFDVWDVFNVVKEIKSLIKELLEIHEKKLYGIEDPHPHPVVGMSSSGGGRSSRHIALNIEEDETVVGFDNDVEMIRERLAGGSKQLDVISIVGMAGLGKTTLVKKLYNDAFVVYHFYIRGWTYVSQVYAKRDLLLSILSSVVEHRDGLFYTLSDEELGLHLYQRLKCKRYLIVMDDIWNTKAWDDIKIYLPNDNNGSRIMITSRLTKVGFHANPDSHPYVLHFLTRDESCDLLKQKVFRSESCPPDLVEITEQIAQKCQGLPLAIVVIAGLLATTDKKKEEWEKLAGSLSSHIASDPEQCMTTLELSYNHLPRHLKSCFLYFGAFPEDHEICVRKMIWLWIAEGFIHQIGQKTMEDVAEEYLVDLIDRNLVLVAKRKFGGGIRTCRVHDLLRDLCSRKGKEENFMQQIHKHEILSSQSLYHRNNRRLFMFKSSSSYLIPIGQRQCRVCIFSHFLEYISLTRPALHIRSLLYFAPRRSSLPSKDISCIYRAFKLLRVLDLSAIYLLHFPREILELFLLRYLELRGSDLTLPESIYLLLNLETLDVSSTQAKSIIVPPDIWKLDNLRHLHIDAEHYTLPTYNAADVRRPLVLPNMLAISLFKGVLSYTHTYAKYPAVLNNLQTISQLCPSKSCEVILARTPNLRKLGFYGDFESGEEKFSFPDLHFLNHLEKLKLNGTTSGRPVYSKRWSLQGLKFPPNLRRLTLSSTYLDWEEMSTLGMLCNLEVLKLECSACVGPRWETTGGGFRRLKFLRLKCIDVVQWETFNTDFPRLQQLVLHRCKKLERIPFEFVYSSTLEAIEVNWCSQSTEVSARRIKEEQQNMGNDLLKILIK